MLPALNPQHIALTDFGHAGQLITQALAAAREALPVGSARPADGGHGPRRDVARPGPGGQATLMAETPGPSGSLPGHGRARVQAPARLLWRRGWRRVARLAGIAAIEEFRANGERVGGP